MYPKQPVNQQVQQSVRPRRIPLPPGLFIALMCESTRAGDLFLHYASGPWLDVSSRGHGPVAVMPS
jgi:hypothetical protein